MVYFAGSNDLRMKKVRLPYLSKDSFKHTAQSLLNHLKTRPEEPGTDPGALIYTGSEETQTQIELFQYNKLDSSAVKAKSLQDLKDKFSKGHVNWVSVTGFSDIELIASLGKHFGIHQLTLEDILNVNQLPKFEEHDQYFFLTMKLLDISEEGQDLQLSHFSMVVRDNCLITFAERKHPLFVHAENLIKNKLIQVKNERIDYLVYRIMDTIVDYYQQTLEWFTDRLTELEFELIEKPSKRHIQTIMIYKKKWLVIRKYINPLKELMRKMMYTDHGFFKSTSDQYINDLQDHLQSTYQTVEVLRETLDNLMDLYNSTVSNKMNEVMQVLTIVSTIFIPITFIAGVYGMNFENMPELGWRYGYIGTLTIMLLTGISMTIYMKRKRWF